MRVLLIEDDATTADYIAQGLREEGHVVDQTSDGREGLVAAQANDYDVLIVDRMLPNLDGMALIKTLRREQPNASTVSDRARRRR